MLKLTEEVVISESEQKGMLARSEQENHRIETSNSDMNSILEKIKTLTDNKYFNFGGYSQFTLKYNNTAEIKTNMAVRSAYIGLFGEIARDLTYAVYFDFRDKSYLDDAYINWAPRNIISLRVGQQRIPIGLDNNTSSSKTDFIQRPLLSTYLTGGSKDVISLQSGQTINGGRDLGIKIYGDFLSENKQPLVSYQLGLYQGSGINRNAESNNKDFSGVFYLHPIDGLMVGGGFYFGSAKYKMQEEKQAKDHVRNRWILSGRYANKLVSFQSEYAHGNNGGIRLEAGYITGTIMMASKAQLVAQAQYLRTNMKSSAHQNNFSGGINYFISKVAKVQLNYTYSSFSKEWNAKNSQTLESQFVILY